MLDLRKNELAEGILGLVVALVEILKDALVHAAALRVQGGRLTDEEVEALGDTLAELEETVVRLKADPYVGKAAGSVREGLDRLVGDLVAGLSSPAPLDGLDARG